LGLLAGSAELLRSAAQGGATQRPTVQERAMGDVTLATITITKTLTKDDILVFVDATCAEGEELALIEALGMVELAKDTLIREAMGA
jgi:hypothetical protein